MKRAGLVRAAMRFLREGIRKPNFIGLLRPSSRLPEADGHSVTTPGCAVPLPLGCFPFWVDSSGFHEAEVDKGMLGGPVSGLPGCLSPGSDAIHPLVEGVGAIRVHSSRNVLR